MKKSVSCLAIALCILCVGSGLISLVLADWTYVSTEFSDSYIVNPLSHRAFHATRGDDQRWAIDVTVTAGGALDINLFIMDASNYANWSSGQSANAEVIKNRITSDTFNFDFPYQDDWYIVLDNSFSVITAKTVSLDVDLYEWESTTTTTPTTTTPPSTETDVVTNLGVEFPLLVDWEFSDPGNLFSFGLRVYTEAEFDGTVDCSSQVSSGSTGVIGYDLDINEEALVFELAIELAGVEATIPISYSMASFFEYTENIASVPIPVGTELGGLGLVMYMDFNLVLDTEIEMNLGITDNVNVFDSAEYIWAAGSGRKENIFQFPVTNHIMTLDITHHPSAAKAVTNLNGQIAFTVEILTIPILNIPLIELTTLTLNNEFPDMTGAVAITVIPGFSPQGILPYAAAAVVIVVIVVVVVVVLLKRRHRSPQDA